MPYKSEKIKIAGTKLDRRIKLSKEDKEIIRSSSGVPIRELARKWNVSRRTIQFILFPERKLGGLHKGKWKKYYSKESQREYMKNHRTYKQNLFLKGKIKEVNKVTKQKRLIYQIEYISGQCVANHRVALKKKNAREALFFSMATMALKGLVSSLKFAQHAKL